MLSARPKDSQGNSLALCLDRYNIFYIHSKGSHEEMVRPKAATFVEAVNIANIAAVKTVAREFPWDSLGRADGKFS